MTLVSRTIRIAPALVLLGFFVASDAHAVNVCGYRVKGAIGFQCPVHTGATVCAPVNANTGSDCQNTLLCFGGLLCQVKLIPFTGPQVACPFESTRLRGFACFAPIKFPTRPPTGTPTSTPTSTEIPFTPTGTPTGTAAATATDTPVPPATATNTGAPAPTATETAAPPATSTSTAVPAATSTDTAVPPPSTATATATEQEEATATATEEEATATATGTATGTAAATVTATHTLPGATATATVAAATATATATAVPATSTATSTVPAATATATRTNVPATATATNTVPASTATATNTVPASTATATRTNVPATATATSTNVPPTATATNTVPANTATATRTSTATATRTATATATSTATTAPPVCPLTAGRYTITQTTGGTLRVATFAAFPFPAGGTLVQDVSAGDANCVHSSVIPFPGGLNTPLFCVPALGATTMVTQTGCGIGQIDSNGGSDFTVSEIGDTSELTVCNVPQATCPPAGPAPDSSGRLDITVGNSAADTCTSGGTANAAATIPVNTLTWVAADSSCPDSDGMFNPATDTKLAEFPQTLDFTTDVTSAKFMDISGDGCFKSGLGPTGPFTETGVCIDIAAKTVTTVAAGTVFSSGGPTYDLLFSTKLPSTLSGPAQSGGATCPNPPVINFNGTATRCLVAP